MIWRMGGEKGKKRCHEESSQKHYCTGGIVQQLLWNFSSFILEEHPHSCKFSVTHFLLANIEQLCSSTMLCVGDCLC